jgi:transposase-like protein
MFDKNKYKLITEEFSSDLIIDEICRKISVAKNVVARTWVKAFGKEAVKERGIRTRQLGYKKQETSGQIKDEINKLFNTDLSFTEVHKTLKEQGLECSDTAIKNTWQRTFGVKKYKERCNRLNSMRVEKQSKSIKEKRADVYQTIKEAFCSGKTLHEVAKELGISHTCILRHWKENFEEQEIQGRSKKLQVEGINNFLNSEKADEYRKRIGDKSKKWFEELKKDEKRCLEHCQKLSGENNHFYGKHHDDKMKAKLSLATKKHWQSLTQAEKDKFNEKVQQGAFKGMQKAGCLGSKNERLCHQLLKEKFPHLKIIHHDTSIYPGKEIDITIPEKRIAIEWQGIFHRKPIYGERHMKTIKISDKQKRTFFKNRSWQLVEIEDDGSYNPNFVNERVNELVFNINKVG